MGLVRIKWEVEGCVRRTHARNIKGRVFVLPNQMRKEENKALGVSYLVKEDKLYVMTLINISRRRMKMRVGQDLQEGDVREKIPNPQTRRELLSQVAGLYDPGHIC